MSLAQRKFFLNNYFSGDTMNLSDRVTALRFQDDVAEGIRLNMQAGVNLRSLTNEISEYTTSEDIAKWVRGVESQARDVIEGDLTALRDFKSTLSKARKEIEDNIESGDATALQKSYLKVISAAEDLSEEGLDKAIDNAIDKKCMYNAYRIAQTETNRAYNMGIYSKALADEDALGMQLDLSYVGNNCDECSELAEADNGAGPGIYPMDDVPKTPIHPNCVLPNSRVSWIGKLKAVSDSFYCGIVVQITSASGKQLTVTANHPVLTSHGWFPAKSINKGQKIVCCKVGQGESLSVNPNNNKRIPRIKDVFRTVKESLKMVSTAMPVSPEDFHGDGGAMNGNVNIVSANGFLLSDVQTAISERVGKNIFHKCNIRLKSFVSNSAFYFSFLRMFYTSYRIVGSVGHSLRSFWRVKLPGHKPIGFGLSSGYNARFYEPAADRYSANTKAVGDAIFRLTPDIAFDDVVNVRFRYYSGHVYNLQVEPEEIYIANGVVAKNCRCILSPVYKLPEGVDQDDLKAEGNFEKMDKVPENILD